MSPMSQDRHLTWPHSGLLSLISRTKISTSVVAWNFPSEAITLRRYFSVSSLSRGFLEEIVHSPSIWLTVNCPSMSPSRRGQEARKKGIYWVLKIRSDKERGYRCVRCRSLRRDEGLAVVTQRGHWCRIRQVRSIWSTSLHGWETPCLFLLFTVCILHWKEEMAPDCKNILVLFCRRAYSLPQNHIVLPS